MQPYMLLLCQRLPVALQIDTLPYLIGTSWTKYASVSSQAEVRC